MYMYTHFPIPTHGEKPPNEPTFVSLPPEGAAGRPWGWLSSLSQGDRAISCRALPHLQLFIQASSWAGRTPGPSCPRVGLRGCEEGFCCSSPSSGGSWWEGRGHRSKHWPRWSLPVVGVCIWTRSGGKDGPGMRTRQCSWFKTRINTSPRATCYGTPAEFQCWGLIGF